MKPVKCVTHYEDSLCRLIMRNFPIWHECVLLRGGFDGSFERPISFSHGRSGWLWCREYLKKKRVRRANYFHTKWNTGKYLPIYPETRTNGGHILYDYGDLFVCVLFFCCCSLRFNVYFFYFIFFCVLLVYRRHALWEHSGFHWRGNNTTEIIYLSHR